MRGARWSLRLGPIPSTTPRFEDTFRSLTLVLIPTSSPPASYTLPLTPAMMSVARTVAVTVDRLSCLEVSSQPSHSFAAEPAHVSRELFPFSCPFVAARTPYADPPIRPSPRTCFAPTSAVCYGDFEGPAALATKTVDRLGHFLVQISAVTRQRHGSASGG